MLVGLQDESLERLVAVVRDEDDIEILPLLVEKKKMVMMMMMMKTTNNNKEKKKKGITSQKERKGT